MTFSLIAITMSLSIAALSNWTSSKYAAVGAAVSFYIATMVVTGLVARLTGGGQLRPLTPAGTALLAKVNAKVRKQPLSSGPEPVLRFAALRGIAEVPRFHGAIELGEPVDERGVSLRMKAFRVAAEVFHTVVELVSGGPG